MRFLVTGANKGIGLAIVTGLLEADKNSFVFLGSRDATRGKDAVRAVIAENTDSYTGRVEALEIDVSSAESVTRAADAVRTSLCGDNLDCLINNAGVALADFSASSFETTLDTNFHGVVRTTEAFLPLLDPSNGRIVMTSSASGPAFVAECSKERRAFLVDPAVTHAHIAGFAEECAGIASSGGNAAKKFAAVGLAGAEYMSGYGVTKALVNMYTMQLAREHPSLLVNACTPGFIQTELTKPLQKLYGKTLDEMGAKPPSEGAKVPVYLATGDVPSSGWYFGSDCQRSPLDRYRAPGSPAYEGK